MVQKQRQRGSKTAEPQAPIRGQWDDLMRLVEHVRANPKMYAGGTVFLAVCLVAGALFRLQGMAKDREAATSYAAAVGQEDPALRMTELQRVVDQGTTRWTAEAAYVLGETAIRAQDYAKAEEAFKRVRDEFSDSAYVAAAVEGLAFLAENKGDLDAALAGYQEVMNKWPSTFEAARQPMNIGRVQKKKGDLKAAVESFQSQVTMFPDSRVSMKAEQELAALKQTNPELFPKEPEPTEEAAPDAAAPATPDAAAPVVVEAPAATAPEVPAPAAPAPVAETPAAPAPEAAAPVVEIPAAPAPEAAAPVAETPAAPAPEAAAPAAETPAAPAPEAAAPAAETPAAQ